MDNQCPDYLQKSRPRKDTEEEENASPKMPAKYAEQNPKSAGGHTRATISKPPPLGREGGKYTPKNRQKIFKTKFPKRKQSQVLKIDR